MKFKDIILVDCAHFKKAVELLEEAGIEVAVPAARRAYFE